MNVVEFRWEGKNVVCRLTGEETVATSSADTPPVGAEWVIEVDGREEARIAAGPMETYVRVETRALVELMHIDARRRLHSRI